MLPLVSPGLILQCLDDCHIMLKIEVKNGNSHLILFFFYRPVRLNIAFVL